MAGNNLAETPTVATQIRFSVVAGYLRLLFGFICAMCYMLGVPILVAYLVGVDVAKEFLVMGIVSLLSGVLIQFLLQEIIALILHKSGRIVFTAWQLILPKKTYDLDKVNAYYVKPNLFNLMGGAVMGGLYFDIRDDSSEHAPVVKLEVGIFSRREVRKIMKLTGLNIQQE